MQVPQTIGAVLGFLALVAPGIIFEARQDRRRPPVRGSTFREIAQVGLASLLLTGTATTLLLAARPVLGPVVVDPRQWLRTGQAYFEENFYLVLGNVVAELALAFLLAVGADRVLRWRWRQDSGNLVKHSLWHQAFQSDKPAGAQPWVHVALTDGSSFFGFVRGSTVLAETDDREIALEGHRLTRHVGPGRKPAVIGSRWEFVIIRAAEIRYLRVQYVDDVTGNVVWSERRARAGSDGHELDRSDEKS